MRSGRAIGLLVLAVSAVWSYQAEPATGSIEGQVVNASTGAPLRKATVQLIGTVQPPPSAKPGQADLMWQQPNHMTREVDEQGRFSFTGLAAGSYTVIAERTGYLPQMYGERRPNSGGKPIVLTSGQHLADVLFKLNPQSVIVGKVVDEDGEGIPNMQVRVLQRRYAMGRMQWTQVGGGQTSDIGEFRVPALGAGKYLVEMAGMPSMSQASSPSNEALPAKPEVSYSNTYYPSSSDLAGAALVEVPSGGEVHGITIRARKTPSYWVRGRVQGVQQARPVTVILSLKDDPFGGMLAGTAAPPDYRFEIHGVAPGSYVARVTTGPAQDFQAIAPVEVRENHVDGIVLTPRPSGELSGTVTVEDAGDQPVSTDTLIVRLSATRMFGPIPSARAHEGAFVLDHVWEGRYAAVVIGIPENCYVKSLQYGGAEIPRDGIEMAPGGAIHITLSATAGSVAASVTDAEGQANEGATVLLVPKFDAEPLVHTVSSGKAAFQNLRPGDYRAIAFEDVPYGIWSDPEFLKKFLDRAADVTVDPKGSQSVQLKVIPASETDQAMQ
jgi:hypothetical protein